MKFTAFKWNNLDMQFFNGKSLHRNLKDRFSCNDYFANSANQLAKGILRSQKELRKDYIADAKADITSINNAITKKKKYLKSLEDTHNSIKTYTKAGYQNPKKLKPCKNVIFLMDGRVKYQFIHKIEFFDNLYLFEHLWLIPKIKQVRQNIKAMEHKVDRLEQKVTALAKDKTYHVCFGTKKLYHDERLHGVNRSVAIRKKRYHSMMVSGRCDCIYGNFVFHYDKEHYLSYRSLTDWNTTITFSAVEFPYGQAEIDDYITQNKGAVAWELRDMGNSWQIACVINAASNHRKNDCFLDGCVSFDMNYDNISFTELDAKGNLLYHNVLPFNLEGKSSDQITNLLSETLEIIFRYASDKKKPLVCENINSTSRKKFYDKNARRTRHISMFACSKIQLLTASKSEKYGIAVTYINPAYTSQIGKFKYRKRYGLTTHESAAFVIGRRGLDISDAVPKHLHHLVTDINKSRHTQWKQIYAAIQKFDWEDTRPLIYPATVPKISIPNAEIAFTM